MGPFLQVVIVVITAIKQRLNAIYYWLDRKRVRDFDRPVRRWFWEILEIVLDNSLALVAAAFVIALIYSGLRSGGGYGQ